MKTILFSIALLLSISNASAAPAGKPVKGTNEAAVQVVTEWLQVYFKAPNEPVIRTAILKSSGKALTIQATLRNNVCTLQLQKNLNANELGWVIAQNICAQALQKD